MVMYVFSVSYGGGMGIFHPQAACKHNNYVSINIQCSWMWYKMYKKGGQKLQPNVMVTSITTFLRGESQMDWTPNPQPPTPPSASLTISNITYMYFPPPNQKSCIKHWCACYCTASQWSMIQLSLCFVPSASWDFEWSPANVQSHPSSFQFPLYDEQFCNKVSRITEGMVQCRKHPIRSYKC